MSGPQQSGRFGFVKRNPVTIPSPPFPGRGTDQRRLVIATSQPVNESLYPGHALREHGSSGIRPVCASRSVELGKIVAIVLFEERKRGQA